MNDPLSWIDFANEDLEMAKAALERGIHNQVCFHAQQGVEKILKAFLRKHRRSVPKIHSLNELLAICKTLDRDFGELDEIAIKLDQYYIPTRYPDALPGTGKEGMPTKEDSKEAINLLSKVLVWVKNKL